MSDTEDSNQRPESEARRESKPDSVGDVVSQLTVKALQEFDTGEMETASPEQVPTAEVEDGEAAKPGTPTERLTSEPRSRSSSRPSSTKSGSVAIATPRTESAQPVFAEQSALETDAPADVAMSPERPVAQSPALERVPSAKASSVRQISAGGVGRPASRSSRVSADSASKDEPVEVTESVGEKVRPESQKSAGSRRSRQQDTPVQLPPEQEQTILPSNMIVPMVAGEGGSSGGGSDEDDDDDDIITGRDRQADADAESDAETDMVVLDPDHPLMKRFQNALHSHLQKQLEKINLELRELEEGVRNKKRERENLGVGLYGVQQELARYQMTLENLHDKHSETVTNRKQTEEELEEVQSVYKETQFSVYKEKKKGSELQSEVENLALRLFYMENAKDDVRSDIAIMRRATERAESEVNKAETVKQNQDLFVDRLVEGVDKMKEEIAMFEGQLAAQSEETNLAKEAVLEARMEIEAINLEKKQLFQQWSSSLIGMRRRDEAHAAMHEALYQQQQRILSLETEIDGFKRSIQGEQEQNEKLTLILNKTELDIATVKKMFIQCQTKHDALKAEYATYTRMLHETEQALTRAAVDKSIRQTDVNGLRKQIEKEYQEKVVLEDEIMEKLRSQLTLDKASQYTDKLTRKMRQTTKMLEQQMAEVENEIAKDHLSISNVKIRIEQLQRVLNELDGAVREKNDVICKSDTEIVKRNAVIERKQTIIDQYNKKMEQLISSAGGVELGPLEIQINSLQKSIDAEQQKITEDQQLWLRQQSELVRLSKEKDVQLKDVDILKKQLTILSQKKIRTEGEVDLQERETYDIERNIRNMQNDIIKLNMLLHKGKGTQTELFQDNILMENDFVAALKEAEHASIEMQDELESMAEEKERLLNSLVEAERQIMLWEKKTQLARETRSAVDSEVGQGEIRAMKSEIHRMQVRYSQLMKQQEKMIQEMEKSVSRRDTIVTRGDAQSKMSKKVMTKGTFQRQMAENKKKIKTTLQDANNCDGEIRDMREHQGDLSQQLETKQITCQQLQSDADSIDGDLERLVDTKQRNLSELLSKQQKMKYYQQAKEGKYVMLCKSSEAIDNELGKQVDRTHILSMIVDRLNQEFPHAQPALRKITLSIGARTLPADDDRTTVVSGITS